MPNNTKEIQRRIKSISNTKKITKAMEMVSAAKMRKAVEAVLRTRTYANLSWTTILNLSRAQNVSISTQPLIEKRDTVRNVCIVLFSSNRGLCGGFNSSIVNKVHSSIQKHLHNKTGEKVHSEFILVGRKGWIVNRGYGYPVAAEFPKLDLGGEIAEIYQLEFEIRPIAKMIIDGYIQGKYDKVMVAFTDYLTPAKQEPRVKQLLPLDIEAEKDHYGILGLDTRVGIDREFIKEKEEKYLKDKEDSYEFTFEPSADEVLKEMIPRLIHVQLLQALLETNASEHSARMASMHQATEAAGDLISELTLYYNKARQAAITSEIAEISAGADALAK